MRAAGGRKQGGVLRIAGTSSCVLHGPYLEPPPSRCTGAS
jgi:hypothetical protein